jgi:Peptidase inhibitor family I36
MKSRFRSAPRLGAAMVLAVVLTVATAVAGGTAASAAEPVRASFGSSTFDMSRGWGAAKACVVYSRTRVVCYASTEQADAALGYSAATDPLASSLVAAPSCTSGWLCLYADVNGGGRRLQFRDEYWNYLSAYGFDRQTSSWRNNQGSSDTGYLSLYNLSTPYSCGANSYALSMGVYNDQAYAVWG